jgi:uncharacterized protein
MNKKDLEKLGLTAETLEKAGLKIDVLEEIIILHGKDIEKHKTDLTAALTEATGLKTQLTEASATIDSFKAMKPEELKAAVNDYKTKYETAQAESIAQLTTLKFNHALQGALIDAKINGVGKVKNTKAILALLDVESIKKNYNEKDDSFVGLKEQLEKVKLNDGYLFEDEDQPPKIVIGGGNKQIVGDAVVNAARKAAGLSIPEN